MVFVSLWQQHLIIPPGARKLSSIYSLGTSSGDTFLHPSHVTVDICQLYQGRCCVFYCSFSNSEDKIARVMKEHSICRKHNSRSSVLVLQRLLPFQQQNYLPQHKEDRNLDEEEFLSTSLCNKATATTISNSIRKEAKFPGSVSRQDLQSPLEAFRDPYPFFDGMEENSIKMMRTAEICRSLTADILIDMMRGPKARLSRTYSSNLVSRLPTFIDHVVVAAASMKNCTEFAHATFEARTKAYIENCKVVPLIRWLKHNSLTFPQIGKLICMSTGEDFDKSIRNLIQWLKTIYVRGKYLGYVMTKADGILDRSLDEMEEIALFLESHGLRREWMGHVVTRCPQLLSLSVDEIKARVHFYLDMGMNDKDFGTMVFDYPKALGFFSLELMNAKVKYLNEFGLSNEETGQLLAFKPQLLGCSIEERWKPLVKYLYYLGVQRDGMKRVLVIKPMVFCIDLETVVVPKVKFLRDIGVREEALGRMIVKFPPLLTYSLDKKIRPVVIYLMTKAGVARADIGKVLALEPELVGCSIIQKLEVNVKYFLSLGIPLQSLGQMIADFPMLLRYNIDVLRPKYRYLRTSMVRPLQDIIEFPRFFSYSLEGRIIPRHEILVNNRVNFKLRHMLACPDGEFDQKVQDLVERRQTIEASGRSRS